MRRLIAMTGAGIRNAGSGSIAGDMRIAREVLLLT